jgi:hypothetical protein
VIASALRLTLFLAEAGLLVYALTLYFRRMYPRLGGSPWRSPLAVVFFAAIAWFLLRALREAWKLRTILRHGAEERGGPMGGD